MLRKITHIVCKYKNKTLKMILVLTAQLKCFVPLDWIMSGKLCVCVMMKKTEDKNYTTFYINFKSNCDFLHSLSFSSQYSASVSVLLCISNQTTGTENTFNASLFIVIWCVQCAVCTIFL